MSRISEMTEVSAVEDNLIVEVVDLTAPVNEKNKKTPFSKILAYIRSKLGLASGVDALNTSSTAQTKTGDLTIGSNLNLASSRVPEELVGCFAFSSENVPNLPESNNYTYHCTIVDNIFKGINEQYFYLSNPGFKGSIVFKTSTDIVFFRISVKGAFVVINRDNVVLERCSFRVTGYADLTADKINSDVLDIVSEKKDSGYGSLLDFFNFNITKVNNNSYSMALFSRNIADMTYNWNKEGAEMVRDCAIYSTFVVDIQELNGFNFSKNKENY